MNIHWNADGYTKNFSFVHEYGSDLIGLFDRKDGTVLDLGCGNGALTHRLAEAGYSPTGMDASPDLLAVAKANYPEIPFIQGDATEFQVPAPYDMIFSNAVLHWIDREKQDDMLHCVNRALKLNGQFVFEFGGCGNNILIHTALERAFQRRNHPYRMPFYFPSIGQYASRLERTGFKVTYATLFDRMTPLKGENGLYDWLCMFIKTPFAEIGAAEKENILRAVVDQLRPDLCHDGIWYSDYVRIRCKAVKVEKI